MRMRSGWRVPNDDRTLLQRIRGEWWWYVSRHFKTEAIRWRIANAVPRSVALLVFVRVFANGDPGPDHLDVYEKIYKAWERREP